MSPVSQSAPAPPLWFPLSPRSGVESLLTLLGIALTATLCSPLYFLLMLSVVGTAYSISQSKLSYHGKLIAILTALAAFTLYKFTDPRPLLRPLTWQLGPIPLSLDLLWAGLGLEVFFYLRTIDYAISKSTPRTPLGQVPHWLSCLHYHFFLPLLFAGPVVSYRDFVQARQTHIDSSHTRAHLILLGQGLLQFLLIGKLLLAASLWLHSLTHHEAVSSMQQSLLLWLYTLVFFIACYYRFAGFSNIGTALARLCGYHIYLNFEQPLRAHNPADFWKRWHIASRKWLITHAFYPYWGHQQIGLKIITVFVVSALWHMAIIRTFSLDAIIQLSISFSSYGLAVFATWKWSQPQSTAQASLAKTFSTLTTLLFISLVHQFFWAGISGWPLERNLDFIQRIFFLHL